MSIDSALHGVFQSLLIVVAFHGIPSSSVQVSVRLYMPYPRASSLFSHQVRPLSRILDPVRTFLEDQSKVGLSHSLEIAVLLLRCLFVELTMILQIRVDRAYRCTHARKVLLVTCFSYDRLGCEKLRAQSSKPCVPCTCMRVDPIKADDKDAYCSPSGVFRPPRIWCRRYSAGIAGTALSMSSHESWLSCMPSSRALTRTPETKTDL